MNLSHSSVIYTEIPSEENSKDSAEGWIGRQVCRVKFSDEMKDILLTDQDILKASCSSRECTNVKTFLCHGQLVLDSDHSKKIKYLALNKLTFK